MRCSAALAYCRAYHSGFAALPPYRRKLNAQFRTERLDTSNGGAIKEIFSITRNPSMTKEIPLSPSGRGNQ
jgi:hypothetical protein